MPSGLSTDADTGDSAETWRSARNDLRSPHLAGDGSAARFVTTTKRHTAILVPFFPFFPCIAFQMLLQNFCMV